MAHRVLADLDRHDDAIVGRDLRRDVETQHRLLELHGGRAVSRTRSDIGNLGALLDARLLVVRRHDARAGDDLASAVAFERRQLEIDQVAAAQVDQRQRNLSGRAGDRQVHVELRRIRVPRARDSRCELKRRLRARFASARSPRAGDDRLGAQRATEAARVPLIEREACLHSEAHAELAAELIVGDDNPALDHDLAHDDVDLPDEPAHFFQPRRRILHEQDVGSRVDHRVTALGEELPVLVGQELLYCIGLLIVELEHLGLQWLEIADLLLGFELLLFLDRKFLARRDQNDVAVLAHVETLGLHDDVQRLIPGNVLEPQCQATGHCVAGDDIQAGEIGYHLQYGAYLDVLEVERQLLALVPGARALRQLVRIFLNRFDLDDEAVVGLVGRVLPEALGLDDHTGVAALRERVDADHRSGEIAYVEAALEVTRKRGLDEIDDQHLALLPDIDAGGVVRQVDNDAGFAVLAAPEINVAKNVRCLTRPRFGES